MSRRRTRPLLHKLNLWAPATTFVQGYDATLQPASNAALNETFLFSVEYVQVTRLRMA